MTTGLIAMRHAEFCLKNVEARQDDGDDAKPPYLMHPIAQAGCVESDSGRGQRIRALSAGQGAVGGACLPLRLADDVPSISYVADRSCQARLTLSGHTMPFSATRLSLRGRSSLRG